MARQASFFQLLQCMQDGETYSGEQLAESLGVSRAAVWKHIKKLQEYGVEIQARSGSGYRLQYPLELLSREQILESLDDVASDITLEILPITDSTNSVLMQRVGKESIHKNVVLAEYQEAGRGRRGNHWLGSYAGGVYLSLGWSFSETPNHLGLLSLYIGNLLIKALKQAGINDLKLKWPNDIFYADQKLAGILIEMRGEAGGAYDVVIGIGINYDMSNQHGSDISQAWTDITSISDSTPGRNDLVALLLKHLTQGMHTFNSVTAEKILLDWETHDYLLGKIVDIKQAENKQTGRVLGIDSTGAIIVEVNEQPLHFSSGEVSVRLVKQ